MIKDTQQEKIEDNSLQSNVVNPKDSPINTEDVSMKEGSVNYPSSNGDTIQKKPEEKITIRAIAPAINQLLRRDLGKYGGSATVNKFFYLTCAIDMLTQHIGENIVAEEVNRELFRLKNTEIESGNKTIASSVKDWNALKQVIDNLRPKLNDIQHNYDTIKDINASESNRSPNENKKIIKFKRACKKLSPYQPEIYFLFNLLMKITDLQRQTIPAEAFRTPELSKYLKEPFNKRKVPTSTQPSEAPSATPGND